MHDDWPTFKPKKTWAVRLFAGLRVADPLTSFCAHNTNTQTLQQLDSTNTDDAATQSLHVLWQTKTTLQQCFFAFLCVYISSDSDLWSLPCLMSLRTSSADTGMSPMLLIAYLPMSGEVLEFGRIMIPF